MSRRKILKIGSGGRANPSKHPLAPATEGGVEEIEGAVAGRLVRIQVTPKHTERYRYGYSLTRPPGSPPITEVTLTFEVDASKGPLLAMFEAKDLLPLKGKTCVLVSEDQLNAESEEDEAG
jgi:hypothetical protein